MIKKRTLKSIFCKLFSYVVISSLNLCSHYVNAQETISLQKAVDIALQNNLQIKQSQFAEALSEEDLSQSRVALLPSLSASPQATENFGRNIDPLTNQFSNQQIFAVNGGISSQAILFQGFQKINQIRQNKMLLEADKTNTAKVKNDLVLNVVTTYLQILVNQDLLKAAKQQIEISKLTLAREQVNFDVGNKTLADLSQAKAQLAANELNFTNAQNQLDVSFLTLKQYMEMNQEAEIKIEEPDLNKLGVIRTDYDALEVFTTAVTTNPDVRLAEVRKQAAFKGIDIAKGNFYPSLVLFGSLGSGYSSGRQQVVSTIDNGFMPVGTIDGSNQQVISLIRDIKPVYGRYGFTSQFNDNFNQSVGLGLSIPIFRNYQARSSVRKAKINYQNASVNAQLAKNNLSKIISQAVLDLRASEKRYYSAQNTFQANKDAFNVIEQRYEVGLVNSLEYNTSQTNLNKSEFDLIQARYDRVFRSKVIDYYLGNTISF
ncbi:MAG: TolC family protein [Sphingobacteriaceae bacterium]